MIPKLSCGAFIIYLQGYNHGAALNGDNRFWGSSIIFLPNSSPLEHELRELYLQSESEPEPSPEFMEWARMSKDMLGIKEEDHE